MSYENITRKHVLDAVAKIKKNNILLRDSTIYDVIINKKAYPPKEIMRYANELANGTKEWTLSGGEPTNSLLEDLGFEVVEKVKKINDIKLYPNNIDELSFTDILSKIGRFHTLSFFNHTIRLMNTLNISANDERITYSISDEKRLNIIIGQRYCFTFTSTRYKYWGFISINELDITTDSKVGIFEGKTKPFFYETPNENHVNTYFNEIVQASQEELDRTIRSSFRKHSNSVLEKAIFDENYRENLFKKAFADYEYPNSIRNYWRIGTSDGNTQKSYWKEMQVENKVCIGWSEIGDLKAKSVSSKDEVVNLMKEIGYYQNDNRTLSRKAGEIFNFYNEIKIGDVILAQAGVKILGIGVITSDYKFDDQEVNDFAHQRKTEWQTSIPDFNNEIGNQTAVYEITDESLIHRIDAFLGKSKENNTKPMPNYPLNQILYGPPGTGKTYKTVDLAYRITQEIEEDDEISYEQARNWFNSELNREDDRQLDFITFHQNYSYEDFVMGIKPDIDGEGLGFREHKGIFFEICQRALKNLQDSQKPIETIEQEKNTEELFEAFKNNLIDEISANGQYKLTESVYIFDVFDDAFVYTGDNWKNKNRMKFEDILKIYNNPNANSRKEAKHTTNIAGLARTHITYYFKIASDLRNFAQKQTINNTKTEKIKLKNYVLIIDEINRANISRVFGELITLIEEDKRWGNDYPMEVRLPDGKTKFTVPKNLYIIGTMNTADKSIALLDIALRRRFEFTALYPDSSLIADGFKLFFETLNSKIKDKKGIDFMVGHAYFMKKKGAELDFIKTMNTKVIPLLNEYFYNTKSNQEVKDLIDKSLTNSNLPYQIQEDAYQLKIINK